MVIDIYTTDKKYKTIYIDPPWMERGGRVLLDSMNRKQFIAENQKKCEK